MENIVIFYGLVVAAAAFAVAGVLEFKKESNVSTDIT